MNKQLASYVGLAALLAGSFLVLNWPYNYVIVYLSETNDAFFLFDRPFLLDFFDYPAGVLRYTGRFLGQFYYCTWLGALIVSASITCFGVLFHCILAKLRKETSLSQIFIPCILLLALHASRICVIHDTLGLCASCGAFLGFLSFRSKAARRAYALAAIPALYFLLGFYVWLFVVWAAVCEWLDGPRRSGLFLGIAYLTAAIAGPLVVWRWVLLISLRSAIICPLIFGPPFRSRWPPTLAYVAADCLLAVLLLASLLLIPFWERLSARSHLLSLWRAWPARNRRAVLAVALPLFVLALHAVQYDAPLSAFVACRCLYKDGQWSALLDKAKENSLGDARLQFMTNFSLSQEQRLLDEMFTYPQPWGVRGLVLHFSGRSGRERGSVEDDAITAMYNSDLFYEMGYINIAFRHAYNFAYATGYTYGLIKRMAQCAMANGNSPMAVKCLGVLDRTLFHRDFARRYQAIIADADATEREFGDLRRRLPVVEHNIRGHPIVAFLMLIAAKSDNRMAFDYLTAWLLLEKSEASLVAISENVERFKSAGYESVPAHCQEALLLWEKITSSPVDLHGFSYDQDIRAEVDRFFQDLSQAASDPGAPERFQALYGDTYMFYYFFVTTPSDEQSREPMGFGFGGGLREE